MDKEKLKESLEDIKEFKVDDKKEEVKIPWYKKHGIKKLAGSVLCILGGVAYLIPHPAAGPIATGLTTLGGLLIGTGVAHTAVKMYNGVDRSQSVWSAIASKMRNNKK